MSLVNYHHKPPQTTTNHHKPPQTTTNNMKAKFKNGDTWTGETVVEGPSTYYVAQDKNGDLYETPEIPSYVINMTGAPSSWLAPENQ